MVGSNVLGGALVSCSTDPMTGWLRDGCCHSDEADLGRHLVCVVMTEEFLEFSRSRGNDLSTPAPAHGFPGLNPGDRWCLCAERWREALEAGMAPQVVLVATGIAALDVVSLDDLEAHAIDAVT
ncbi:MAG: DUF2237 domain-containing protein [bacterium]|nr:DUF2237 domain-containing protein [bacterium]